MRLNKQTNNITQPLVSIIIPIYNTQPYLRQCIDSALTQTYSNIEVILVDDGSTDGSGAICDDYAQADKRIRVIHQQNSGLSVARNNAISKAQGKYIQFLDSDDWIDINCISECVEICETSDCDMVFFEMKEIDEAELGIDKDRYKRKKQYSGNTGITVFSDLIHNNDFYVPVYMYLIRQSLIRDNNLLFPPGIIHEDIFFTFSAFIYAKRVFHIYKQFYIRRIRCDSITSDRLSINNAIGILTNLKLLFPYYRLIEFDSIKSEIYSFSLFWYHHLIEVCLQITINKEILIDTYNFAFDNGLLNSFIATDYVIWYGYGNRCKQLLGSKMLPHPNEIWDINAINSKSNSIRIPDYNTLVPPNNILIVVCVDNNDVIEQVKSKAASVGFNNVTDWRSYLVSYCGNVS